VITKVTHNLTNFKNKIELIFLFLAIIFLALLLRSQWDTLRQQTWQLQSGWLLLSAAFLLLSWLLEVKIWQRLLDQVGGDLPFGNAFRIWFLSAIMRYIPGNIWQPVSMTLRCQQHAIRPEATITSIALYQAITLLAVIPLSPVYIVLSDNLSLLNRWLGNAGYLLILLAISGLLVLLIYPSRLMALLNWGLNRLGREGLQAQLSSHALFQIFLLATLNWLLWGIAFATLTFALGEYSLAEQTQWATALILAYPIAYAIGFLSFITPSGFGVREGALYILLAPLLGSGVITVAALAMRVWTTAGEFILAAYSWFTSSENKA